MFSVLLACSKLLLGLCCCWSGFRASLTYFDDSLFSANVRQRLNFRTGEERTRRCEVERDASNSVF